MNWRSVTAICICLLAVIIFSPASQAKINIQADRSGHWDFRNNLVTMEENVRIELEELQIRADQLVWDIEANQLTVMGNVVFTRENQDVFADKLVYNINAETGWIYGADGSFLADGVQGPVFVASEQIELDGDNFFVADGRITTCDLPESHYYVSAKQIEIYPDDRIIIRGVTYYEGKIPLFYWPYLVVPLHEDVRQSSFALPQIGYGAEEGYFIKNTYNYYFNPRAYGSVYGDFYSRLGTGFGVTHNYRLSPRHNGELHIYSIPAEQKALLETRWSHHYTDENLYLSTEAFYREELVDGQPEEEVRGRTDLSWANEQTSLTGSADFLRESADSTSTEWETFAGITHSLSEQWQLNLEGSYSQKENYWGEPQKMIDYLTQAKYQEGPHSVFLTVEQEYNPDLVDSEERANWTSVNRIPEASWQWRQSPIRTELAVGRYREFPSRTEGQRAMGSVHLLTQSLRPGPMTTLTYNGSITGFAYDTGQNQGAAEGRLNLYQRLGSQLTLSSSYTRRLVGGETPFRFDQQKERNILSGQLRFNGEWAQASLRTGYDFERQSYQSLIGNLRLTNDRGWQTDLYASFNLNTKQTETIVPMVSYQVDDEVGFRLGGRYRVDRQEWQRIDGEFVLDLSETWRVGYEASYLPQSGTWNTGQLTLRKDLHCREIAFRYDQVRQEFWFEYKIYAFPDSPLRVGSETITSLFDLDDPDEILGEE